MKKIVIENCTLYHGLSEEILTMLKNESVDAIITDPPYLYLKNQKLDIAFDEEKIFSEWARVLSKDRLIAFFGRGDSFYRWNLKLNTLSFKFKEECIWEKNRCGNFLNDLPRMHELFCIREKGKCRINKTYIDSIEKCIIENNFEQLQNLLYSIKNALSDKNISVAKDYIVNNKIDYKKRKSKYKLTDHTEKYPNIIISNIKRLTSGAIQSSIFQFHNKHNGLLHPTEKPVALMEMIINLVTKENQIVLDCFLGGGTTGVACINTNRKFIGIERDEEYFNIAVKRIKEAVKEKYKKVV